MPGSAILNTGGRGQLASVSCYSAGNCAAGGYYTTGSGLRQAFVVSEHSGVWGKAIPVPGLATLSAGGYADLISVSCGPAASAPRAGSRSTPASRRSWSAAANWAQVSDRVRCTRALMPHDQIRQVLDG